MDLSIIINTIATLATVFISFVLSKYLYNRAKLVTYCLHASAHKIKDPAGIINTHAIVIRNAGRIAAKNVRVGHYVFPELSCTVTPPIEYEKKEIEGGTELIFPTLVPQEQIVISYLYFPPITIRDVNTYVKSDEGFAKILNIIPSPKLPGWLEKILYILLFIGGVVVMRIIIQLIIFIFQSVSHFCVF
ncbi:TPA: hypothetical protein RG395_003000 [Legionella pneumophila]|uniref:Uncharacterized protein n=4 Tax=Legionella TaxID=445 RepID=W0BBM1_9GAMM|nr:MULTISPECIES: hypothetical protein [Legionella]STY15740.1 Uncharacterised protein [Legionella longbeachae]HAT8828307.1 hypothetical protein [Legionella pneumophila subsp. pneumophila]AHE65799.1 hypothetical protein Loa_00210 [Legionella oakridgensis ATCC 33761 = DSM 21215]ANN91252.1 hypothetical protein A9P85_00865 [Legionella pneumophila]KTD38131.1 hypothetical protein Loak_1807 [Legionella oakridgensis]